MPSLGNREKLPGICVALCRGLATLLSAAPTPLPPQGEFSTINKSVV